MKVGYMVVLDSLSPHADLTLLDNEVKKLIWTAYSAEVSRHYVLPTFEEQAASQKKDHEGSH